MIRIEAAGLGSTVQDTGRRRHQRAGVPVSGPADPLAFAAAQAIVGNGRDDAAIEIVGTPFVFTLDDARLVAVTGREVELIVRDVMPGGRAVFVRAGQRVTVRGTERTRYAYLAVSGGIATPRMLGSRSAYPRAALGAALRSGEALPLGASRRGASDAGRRVVLSYDGDVDAIAGPHVDRFAPEVLDAFFGATFRARGGDRQGLRIEGATIASRGGEILTCGVVSGAVQVPPAGDPIVLLADHQTTGGYPVIATVIAADIGKVAQRAAGEDLRFRRVDPATARERLRTARAALGG